jgi:hypothetical protein
VSQRIVNSPRSGELADGGTPGLALDSSVMSRLAPLVELRAGNFVISVPPRELGGRAVPGSLFDRSHLAECPISDELRAALPLLTEHDGGAALPTLCIARPEIFTSGASLAWLQQRLGSVRAHVCLSDGTSFRPIPRFRNHLFLYGLQRRRDHTSLANLISWAPELFNSATSQVNSFLRFTSESGLVRPPITILPLREPVARATGSAFDFYLNPHSVEDSVTRILGRGERQSPLLHESPRVTYIPLTETATCDQGFCRLAAEEVARAYFDPNAAVLLQLASPVDGASTIADRLGAALRAIRDGGVALPRAASTNTVFLMQDISESQGSEIGNISLLAHETFGFWRYTPGFYARLNRLTLVFGSRRKGFAVKEKDALRQAFGRLPTIVTLPSTVSGPMRL